MIFNDFILWIKNARSVRGPHGVGVCLVYRIIVHKVIHSFGG